MKTIRWGIIGCGDVTEIKSGPGFQKAWNSELIAVMRRDGERARDYAKRHGVPKWYDSAEELLSDPDVDAVYVATPPSSHKSYTIDALSAGKPVLVEKPMALNYDECQVMLQASVHHNVPLFTAYYRRALPRFLQIKSLLEENVIGPVVNVSVQYARPPLANDLLQKGDWRTDPSIGGAGYFSDLACHTIDLLQYYIGPITTASGSSGNQLHLYPIDDMFTAVFGFDSGATGEGKWNFSSQDDVDRVLIQGAEGTISFATFRDDPVIVRTTKKVERRYIAHPQHVHQPLIQSIVDELNGSGTCASTGISGARTSWVMDKILGTIK
jgi:predicted dehydrogenase